MATQKKSPLAQMKDEHKDKESLVDRVLSVIDLGGSSKDDVKARLLAASNKKLLRLLDVGNTIKKEYGSPSKLAEALASAVGKAKDSAYVQKIAKLAVRQPARVLDMVRAASKRATSKAAE
jgi:hypothetical protein